MDIVQTITAARGLYVHGMLQIRHVNGGHQVVRVQVIGVCLSLKKWLLGDKILIWFPDILVLTAYNFVIT